MLFHFRRESLAMRVIMLVLASACLLPATAIGQGSMFEYQACFQVDYSRKDWDPVIFACSRLIADASLPSDLRAKAYAGRHTAYVFKRDSSRAIADISEAIKLDPKNTRYYNERAGSYRAAGQLDLALADFNELIRLEPKNDGWYMNRGQAFAEKGDYSRAIADCDTAIRINPKVAYWYVVRGEYYEKKGDRDRAIADYRKSLEVDPSRPESRDALIVLRH
jgi:tetratricopeptide (TPR) repeat protein